MNLLLVRHGDATGSENGDKILSPLGHQQITRTARAVAENLDFRLDNVYHSGKTRARQTAEILAHILKSENEISATTGLSPLDSPSIWAERLKALDTNIALVGHMPFMSEMAAYLTKEPFVYQFYTATIVHLIRNSDNLWAINSISSPVD